MHRPSSFATRFAARPRLSGSWSSWDPHARPDSTPRWISGVFGLANQTTMLMSESLEIGELIRKAMAERYGEDAFSITIVRSRPSAARRRIGRDAIQALLGERRFDLAVVIGGYNSSNTKNLARMCAHAAPTFHIAEPACLVSPSEIRHRRWPGRPATRVRAR